METEPDAGLGNGGLGRLAACFIDSLATLGIPAIGYGLRYDYGIFRQELADGLPAQEAGPVAVAAGPVGSGAPGPRRSRCRSPLRSAWAGMARSSWKRGQPMQMVGIPYDRPIVGFGGRTINTLRLWKAGTHSDFNFGEFSGGDFFAAVSDQVLAESLTLRPLSGRLDAARPLAAVPPGIFPRLAAGWPDIVHRFQNCSN